MANTPQPAALSVEAAHLALELVHEYEDCKRDPQTVRAHAGMFLYWWGTDALARVRVARTFRELTKDTQGVWLLSSVEELLTRCLT